LLYCLINRIKVHYIFFSDLFRVVFVPEIHTVSFSFFLVASRIDVLPKKMMLGKETALKIIEDTFR
jgi:hypothetical protein